MFSYKAKMEISDGTASSFCQTFTDNKFIRTLFPLQNLLHVLRLKIVYHVS
jgi:hypothetical protein